MSQTQADEGSAQHGTGRDVSEQAASQWEQLMARAQQGDQVAYRVLLVAVTPYLRGLARRYLDQGADVEDAVQDILLTLHDVRHTYEPGRPFKPWLAMLAQRRAIDLLRARTRRSERHGGADPLDEFADDAPDPEALAIAGQEASLLRHAVARLAPGQRRAVELVHLDELGLQQAATQTDRTSNAMKVAAHRALRQLRSLLRTKTRHD